MEISGYLEEINAAITVCDAAGIIISMNSKARFNFVKDGGASLIGTSLFDCHSGYSAEKLKQIMENQQTNVYTIEKNGIRKMIYQTPWYNEGIYSGLIELSIELPVEVPHFIRK